MVERAVADHPSFRASRVEMDRSGPSYTVDTVRLLCREQPDTRFFLIVGADMVLDLPRWVRIEEILASVEVIGLMRPGVKLDMEQLPDHIKDRVTWVKEGVTVDLSTWIGIGWPKEAPSGISCPSRSDSIWRRIDCMNQDERTEAVRKQLPKTRWEHTLRVVETAVELADRVGVDRKQARLAALLHDYCKFWPRERMERIIRERGLPQDLLKHHVELWHAPVGAEVVREELEVEDEGVLDAIRYHTTGRPHMSLLDKVIFLADYIEPGDSFLE